MKEKDHPGNPYENPNISHYEQESELDTERRVFHCHALMRPSVKGHVLDVGAGQGMLTDAFTRGNKSVKSVTCIDLSDYHGKLLRKKGYKVIKRDLDKFPYVTGKQYDTIITSDVIEHLLSPYLHLVECHRLLRKGGTLIISTPQAEKTMVTHPHIIYFSPKGLELLLRRAGFKKVRRVYNGVLSPTLTRITSRIPVLRNILSNGCYYIATK
jgi:SAM-dependent methyltransferase